ncbi:MAG: hypothetical protein J3R72DRAFT_471032 [Linnemannia gamsii]|nr:MAG: hypothetical protein J3R72DRAFT_471032 [Linnemannia gamsii]
MDRLINVQHMTSMHAAPGSDVQSFTIKYAMRKHLERTECWQERSDFPLEPVTIPDATPAVLSPSTVDPLPATRGHDDAILYACQQMHTSKSDKVDTLFITESLGLVPFVLRDTLGNEQNALAHPDILKRCLWVNGRSPAPVGSILLNCNGSQAVIANTIGSIGVPGVSTPTGSPSTRLAMTISAQDGVKLVIGTQSCNALVTSSLRLVLPEQASVDGATLSFVISTADASNATRIFLDQESVNAALVLAANKKAWEVSNRRLPTSTSQDDVS